MNCSHEFLRSAVLRVNQESRNPSRRVAGTVEARENFQAIVDVRHDDDTRRAWGSGRCPSIKLISYEICFLLNSLRSTVNSII